MAGGPEEGKSLADHLAAKPVVVASADPAERTATDAFGSTAARARKSVRAMRTGALVGFFALCAVAGALATKHWHGGAAPNAGAARVEKDPRSAAPGAERNPATVPTAEKTLPSTTVLPAVATNPSPTTTTTTTTTATPNAKTKAKVKPAAIRQARNAAAGPTSGPRPTADSRLGAWDPDSPVPP